jgi:hypothetical protein
MRHVWLSGIKRLEILKPQVDDGGYDLVLEGNAITRHVQLKATFRGSKVHRFNLNMGLALKPSGCAIVMLFDPKSLELGPYLWLGGLPGKPLPDLSRYPVGKHTKRDAKGVKGERAKIRVVPRAAFQPVPTIPVLAERLFGAHARQGVGQAG